MTETLVSESRKISGGLDWKVATINLISKQSIDSLTVSGLCDAAAISRPTFYSRFGNIDGLLAEIWLENGLDWLESLSSSNFEQSIHSRAISQILAVSRRKPELDEVVRPVMQSWRDQIGASDHFTSSVWLAANRIGVGLLMASDPRVQEISAIDKSILDLMSRDSVINNAVSSNPNEFSLTSPKTGEQLLDAAISVISNAGYRGASMSRIARLIQITTGAIYPQFNTTESLLMEAYVKSQQIILEQNSCVWEEHGFSVRNFGQFVSSGLSEERSLWRKLRLETVLASSSNDGIREAVIASIADSAAALQGVISKTNLPEEFKKVVHYLFHSLGVGFGVVHEYIPEVANLPHVEMAESLGASLLR